MPKAQLFGYFFAALPQNCAASVSSPLPLVSSPPVAQGHSWEAEQVCPSSEMLGNSPLGKELFDVNG
jgi:hypothetical protein